METNALIRNSQHGFRKGRSCLTNLLLFLDKVLHGVNDGFSVDVVFLDLAKAFDKVPVDASSINAFKGCLNKITEMRMGFFMD